jgi:hypothetical protein
MGTSVTDPIIAHGRRHLAPKHDDSAVSVNERVGLFITRLVGTMWAAYAFVLLSLVSLPVVILSHDPVIIVGWVAQTFLQLVLLPVIIVGQNLSSRAGDARALATAEHVDAILAGQVILQQNLLGTRAELLALKTSLADTKPKPRVRTTKPKVTP